MTDGSQTEQAAQNATEAAANGDGLVVNEVEQPADDVVLSDADKEALNLIEEQGLSGRRRVQRTAREAGAEKHRGRKSYNGSHCGDANQAGGIRCRHRRA